MNDINLAKNLAMAAAIFSASLLSTIVKAYSCSILSNMAIELILPTSTVRVQPLAAWVLLAAVSVVTTNIPVRNNKSDVDRLADILGTMFAVIVITAFVYFAVPLFR